METNNIRCVVDRVPQSLYVLHISDVVKNVPSQLEIEQTNEVCPGLFGFGYGQTHQHMCGELRDTLHIITQLRFPPCVESPFCLQGQAETSQKLFMMNINSK